MICFAQIDRRWLALCRATIWRPVPKPRSAEQAVQTAGSLLFFIKQFTGCHESFPLVDLVTARSVPKSSGATRGPEILESSLWSARIARRVQCDLSYDYRTNVQLYPKWQATREGSEAYLKDLPHAEMHRLDAGEGTRLSSKEDAVGVSRKPHRRQL